MRFLFAQHSFNPNLAEDIRYTVICKDSVVLDT